MVFRIEGITDDNFPSFIGSALLKVVAVGYSIIIMAGAASSFWAVRNFTIGGEGASIVPPQDNFFVQRNLGRDRNGMKERKRKESQNS